MGKSVLFACLMPLVGLAQGFSELAGGRSLGLAHSSVVFTDVWSACHNPGAMAQVEGTQGGLSYEKRYFLEGLNLGNMVLVHSVEGGALGFSFGLLGSDLYQKMRTGLAYAHSFGQSFSAGLKLSYGRESIPETAYRGEELLISPGFIVSMSDKFSLGLSFQQTLKSLHASANPGFSLRLGGIYHFTDKLLLATEIYKTVKQPEIIRCGLEYLAAETLALRMGMATAPWRHNMGVGFNYEGYSCDLGFEYSYTLGATANISLQYSFK